MFGYITPVKPQLRICDYDLYKAVYCGICNELQSNFGFFSKSFLNYDFVFLAMLGRSVKGEAPITCPKRCNINFLKKCQIQKANATDNYCAAALITSAYFKLLDNIDDEGIRKRLASRLALPFAKRGYNKAKALYPQLTETIKVCCDNQAKVEAEPYRSMDRAADNTSKALSIVLSGLTDNPADKRILERLGYLIGRFVYIADAADDLNEDSQNGRYNPLLLEFPNDDEHKEALAFAKTELNATASEIANSYNLLNKQYFSEILDNIIFLGLKRTIHTLGIKERKQTK